MTNHKQNQEELKDFQWQKVKAGNGVMDEFRNRWGVFAIKSLQENPNQDVEDIKSPQSFRDFQSIPDAFWLKVNGCYSHPQLGVLRPWNKQHELIV
ncbi:hypothetical protein [Cylindrospermopsis raciborskii]|uniref:Uncharacterized protein n=1 Tax=Cylindrospermopsis raciborskii CENA302 TaxID=1170768 RepID=A0A9Q5WAE5_9CYAN|nr:hypothetical protein [Cylindrospermopsis raciborskii]MCZ2202065.1 hypothetical protein [Cylindrospermopsis raciborskii PAMP2012]MCZ2207126.1 hypothetical protein [Cylindrospermopsis raciborskii PAMP2011]NLQ04367.1 hypothetical protein [Cylindrospermopsis raciborskii MVCC19]OPH10542.1 hypothetical protein CENA302_04760 [Cylindrospermopsis raciborskii CENA302]